MTCTRDSCARVSFAPTGRVKRHLSRWDMTDVEQHSYWYGQDDMSRIQSEMVEMARSMRRNDLRRRDDPTYRAEGVNDRGIEHMRNSDALKERKRSKLAVISAVLDQQERNRARRRRLRWAPFLRRGDERRHEEGDLLQAEVETELIAQASREASGPARQKAWEWGAADAARASAVHFFDDSDADSAVPPFGSNTEQRREGRLLIQNSLHNSDTERRHQDNNVERVRERVTLKDVLGVARAPPGGRLPSSSSLLEHPSPSTDKSRSESRSFGTVVIEPAARCCPSLTDHPAPSRSNDGKGHPIARPTAISAYDTLGHLRQRGYAA